MNQLRAKNIVKTIIVTPLLPGDGGRDAEEQDESAGGAGHHGPAPRPGPGRLLARHRGRSQQVQEVPGPPPGRVPRAWQPG